MQEQARVPAIRFAGFRDDWEQHKLEELVERVVRKNINNESSLPLTISSQYGLVDQITYFNNRVASRDVSNYYLVLNGEFAYNKSTSDGFPVGAVKRLDLYEKGVLSTLYIVFSIKDLGKIDSDFLTVFFDTDRWHKGVSERAAEGARNHGLLNISAEDFLDIDICVPKSKPEQTAIGTFIRNLDHLITLHQRKYSRLCNVKKSMLEKMFPKDGASMPEIRFAGFTDAWEQRKLGDVVDVCSGRDYKHLGEGVIPVYGTGGYMLDVSEALSEKEDAIGIGRKGTIDNPYILRAPFWTVDTLFYCIPKKDFDLDFVFSIYQNINWKAMDESTGVPSLSKTAINNVAIMAPSKNEQVKLGRYFASLDHLITLHQRELERLQNIKKACLEKMFV